MYRLGEYRSGRVTTGYDWRTYVLEHGQCVAHAPECVSLGLWQLTCERTSQFHELSTNGSEQRRGNEGRVKAALSHIWWMRD